MGRAERAEIGSITVTWPDPEAGGRQEATRFLRGPREETRCALQRATGRESSCKLRSSRGSPKQVVPVHRVDTHWFIESS